MIAIYIYVCIYMYMYVYTLVMYSNSNEFVTDVIKPHLDLVARVQKFQGTTPGGFPTCPSAR